MGAVGAKRSMVVDLDYVAGVVCVAGISHGEMLFFPFHTGFWEKMLNLAL